MDSSFGSPSVMFSKRRAQPAGYDTTSNGSAST
jgi:hypothetical protein